MKVVCEYCDSYVEADENMKCPLCGAALGAAVQSEQERIEAQEEAQHQRELEVKAQEAKDDHISEVITGVANVATAFAAGAGLSGTLNNSADGETDDEGRPPEPPHGRRMPPSENGQTRGNHRGGPGGPGGPGSLGGQGGRQGDKPGGHGGPGGQGGPGGGKGGFGGRR